MNLDHIITNATGLLHTAASILALAFGTWVLLAKKGNKRHKQMGYAYTVSMTIVLLTSFFMYNLFGGFGIFHIFAIISSVTLVAGMAPIIRRKPNNYITLHYNFMYWSVIGLYGAFLAEILTRIPPLVIQDKEILPLFFALVGVSVFIVMGLGYYFMFRKRYDWSQFEHYGRNQTSGSK